MNFEFEEDRQFFKGRFACCSDLEFEKYLCLFDERPSSIKRKEFETVKHDLFMRYTQELGERCLLRYDICDPASGFCLDHIIPLSSNELNKRLRKMKAEPGKKVPSQSLGSNDPNNLILACNKCNAHKKHILLPANMIDRIFRETRRFKFER